MQKTFYLSLILILFLVSCESKTQKESLTELKKVNVVDISFNEVSITPVAFSLNPSKIELSKDDKKWVSVLTDKIEKKGEQEFVIKGLDANTCYFARVQLKSEYIYFNFKTKELKTTGKKNLFVGKYKGIFNVMWENEIKVEWFHKDSLLVTQPFIKGSQIVIGVISSELVDKDVFISFKANIKLLDKDVYEMIIPRQYIKNIDDYVNGRRFFSMTQGTFSKTELDYCINFEKRKIQNSFTAGKIIK